jgi:hypothetical protein
LLELAEHIQPVVVSATMGGCSYVGLIAIARLPDRADLQRIVIASSTSNFFLKTLRSGCQFNVTASINS